MKKDNLNLIMLWLAVSLYVLYLSLLSVLKLNSFAYHDFDLAVHALTSWNILQGSIYNSILGIPFLGNHMQPVLFLTAPVYALFPDPKTLLLSQTLALGLGAFPLYLIAKKRIGPDFALIIALGYLLYPGLAFTNLFEFHPTSFATFFLICSLYAYDLGKIKLFITSSLLAMLCQENVPMAVIMLGVLAFIEKKGLKWVVIPIISGGIYFIAALGLMSYFNQGTVEFSNLYSHLGASPIGLILNPLASFKFILRQESLNYLFNIFLPVLFIPLLALVKLLPVFPFFFQHLLSARPSDLSMNYHYTAEIIPFVFFSLVYGISRLLKIKFIREHVFVLKSVLMAFILFSSLLYGPLIKESLRLNSDYRKDYSDFAKKEFIAKVPRAAAVVATFEFLPALANRKSLYSLHHPYMGFYTLSSKRYSLPDDVKYAVIDFNDGLTFRGFYQPEGYKNLQEIFLKDQWKIIGMVDSLVMLKKSSEKQDFICAKVSPKEEDQGKEILKVGESFALKSAHFVRIEDQAGIEATFYWQSFKKTGLDIQMFITLTDSQGRAIKSLMHPICYRIFPTQSWQEGDNYKELLRIYIPEGYFKDDIFIIAGFYDYLAGNIIKLNIDGGSYDLANIGSLRCEK